jgi:hypothetical protein
MYIYHVRAYLWISGSHIRLNAQPIIIHLDQKPCPIRIRNSSAVDIEDLATQGPSLLTPALHHVARLILTPALGIFCAVHAEHWLWQRQR